MGEETIKVSVGGLTDFAKKLETYRIEIGDQAGKVHDCPPLLPGNDVLPESANLKKGSNEFMASVASALTTIQADVKNIESDLEMAGTMFNLGAEDSLTEAQMMEILHDVLGGGSPSTSVH
ncbi:MULTISPECIES: hypothetical protein [unclassified Kitasatospora]|uniref:hypothetical protein n=1 Tax=unclassified Kitasatospora TaxID=2633591 RepID=UPI0033C8381E